MKKINKTKNKKPLSLILIFGVVLALIGILGYFLSKNQKIETETIKTEVLNNSLNNKESSPTVVEKTYKIVTHTLTINNKKLELTCEISGEEYKDQVERNRSCENRENHLYVNGIENKTFAKLLEEKNVGYFNSLSFTEDDGQRFVRIWFSPCMDNCGSSETSFLLDTETLQFKRFDLANSLKRKDSFRWEKDGNFLYSPAIKNPTFDKNNIDSNSGAVIYDLKGNYEEIPGLFVKESFFNLKK